MPYSVVKKGSKYCLVRKTGPKKGTTKSSHTSYTKAERARRLLAGIEHGWKPTGKKATRPVRRRTAKRGGRTRTSSKGRRK